MLPILKKKPLSVLMMGRLVSAVVYGYSAAVVDLPPGAALT